QRVADAAEDGVLVGTLSELRQVLADLDAGDVGIDRVELAAILARRVGLEVESIHVRRAAAKIDEDACLAARIGGHLARRRQAEIAPQRKPCSQGAHFQKVASSNSVAVTMRGHEIVLSGNRVVACAWKGGPQSRDQWLTMNSLVLSNAHMTSRRPVSSEGDSAR